MSFDFRGRQLLLCSVHGGREGERKIMEGMSESQTR